MTHTVRKDTEEGWVVSLEQPNFCENECVVRQWKFFSTRHWLMLASGKLEKENEERREKQEAFVRRLVESAHGSKKSVA